MTANAHAPARAGYTRATALATAVADVWHG